ncbi:MAG: aminotransferase class V-fold PLP-dependent enzyme [Sandarakinorhabdus sp.]|nr:aminotransferase class V-fold PLP-dependent enzyme [Sandarakinorhabdus sp.]
MDAADPLAPCRARFTLPPGVIYLDGNSLGPVPAAAATRIADAVTRQWGEGLIRSWNDAHWIDLPATIGAAIAPIIGADPASVIACDSVSINIFKLAGAALAMRPDRTTIVCETDDFPTDRYILAGLARLTGAALKTVPRNEIAAAINGETALVLLTHAHYATGAVHDMAAISAAAHAAGALTLWDLSHSAGALHIALDRDGADFAVGCGYKYLNGGPGAPAFAYAAARHHAALLPPLQGWMGHAAPFDFAADYAPAPGIRRLLTGTPPILAMVALAAGVTTFDGVDMPAAEAKSAALAQLFARLATEHCPQVITETPVPRHGAQVICRHPHARRVMAALIARGVIGDCRPPDRMRFGFSALYTRFADVGTAIGALAAVLESAEWQAPSFEPQGRVS